MEALAVIGITLEACGPIREAAIPRMLSDGRLINSISFLGAPSVEPSHSSRISSGSTSGASGALFRGAQRLNSIVEMLHQHATAVILH